MGCKSVCLTCRKAFNNNPFPSKSLGSCQECGSTYVFYNHKFRPPARNDLKAWAVVKFLYSKGFKFQHVNERYIKTRQYGCYVFAKYPKSMKQAKEFVVRYKMQALDLTPYLFDNEN